MCGPGGGPTTPSWTCTSAPCPCWAAATSAKSSSVWLWCHHEMGKGSTAAPGVGSLHCMRLHAWHDQWPDQRPPSWVCTSAGCAGCRYISPVIIGTSLVTPGVRSPQCRWVTPCQNQGPGHLQHLLSVLTCLGVSLITSLDHHLGAWTGVQSSWCCLHLGCVSAGFPPSSGPAQCSL